MSSWWARSATPRRPRSRSRRRSPATSSSRPCTPTTAGAVSRLLEMGVEDYLLASSLLGVLAQRLVRKVCAKCRRPAEVTAAVMREIGGNGAAAEVYEGEGCDDCARTGYRGRSGIFEILLVNDVIRPLILKR